MDTILRIGLPVYVVLMFVVAIGGRSYVFWKRTGINPYKLGDTESAHDFVGTVFKLISLLVLVAVLIFSLLPGLYRHLIPLGPLEQFWVQAAGAASLVIALIWIIYAQTHMKASWRIGIDKEHRTELIETGLFHISRNPIFLGMRVALLGFFLTMPNVLTLVTISLGDLLIQIQVRLEEEHLTEVHGDEYLAYKKRVRRWI